MQLNGFNRCKMEVADARGPLEDVAIILISSDSSEILHVADRILVMHEGRLTADISRPQASEEAIMKAAVS